MRFLSRLLRRLLFVALGAVLAVLAVRVWLVSGGPPLEPWHLYVPPELHAAELDRTDWAGYLRAEERAAEAVRTEVTERLPPRDRIPLNRYFEGSPVYPGHFRHDWNRSYVLEPEGTPRGAVVLLHGLTDAPYSLRHVARYYRDHGYLAIGIRLPAHGTVPGALTDVVWEDWTAATRLAMREARRRVPSGPVHVVGFSNGGALAMKQALDSLDDPAVVRPDQVVLLSPMIGVTGFARFAGFAGLPALLPRFAKAAWLGVVAEFNPFKYNSFPVNGARQSWRLTRAVQEQLDRRARAGQLDRLPPVLTFQSVLDFTVSTPAVINTLYGQLPANGSELVLFDINRNASLGPLFTPGTETALDRLLPAGPRRYRTVVVTNASPDGNAIEARLTEANGGGTRVAPLRATYPRDVFSQSHVSMPFPQSDSLYGMEPDPADEDFGVHFGTVAPRGERGALAISLDALLRMSSNPFFDELLERIGTTIDGAAR
ncbi:alpha/beta hydrolase [Roseomonas sp. NAR14]|uniref:Alpha/beta hydrolase n=1 Tax=Roseomonas acroporae TaxID=2937791 RepID=A0A9X2BWN2_9PROT|nr:alpha/beta hydrolase [Roseomonas acroporae]MCK8786236.1 alpha/beta hydrolase [Roseomonas acroporae]